MNPVPRFSSSTKTIIGCQACASVSLIGKPAGAEQDTKQEADNNRATILHGKFPEKQSFSFENSH
jgi:hypothetical protein